MRTDFELWINAVCDGDLYSKVPRFRSEMVKLNIDEIIKRAEQDRLNQMAARVQAMIDPQDYRRYTKGLDNE